MLWHDSLITTQKPGTGSGFIKLAVQSLPGNLLSDNGYSLPHLLDHPYS